MSKSRRSPRTESGPRLPEVQQVELSEKHIHLRLWLTIAFAVVGVGLLVFAVRGFFSAQDGWKEIDVTTSGGLNCASEFRFRYELGAGELSANQEYRQISQLYTTATETLYREFHLDEGFEDVHNLYYLNRHPNEVVSVSDLLYDAFSQVQAHHSRALYLAPVYSLYRELFRCEDGEEAKKLDPMMNPELVEFVQELSALANDPEAVELELLGENQVRLRVSEAYLQYAQENAITNYIDFFWMTNAFGADYIAQTMIDAGFTNGVITSYDGYTRCLDQRGTDYSYQLYDRDGNTVYTAGSLRYTGPTSFVFFKNYERGTLDVLHYYELEGGQFRTAYLDPADGRSKCALPQLLGYSSQVGCAELMLSLAPVYLADQFQPETLDALHSRGVETVYPQGSHCLVYTEAGAQIEDLYDRNGVTYTAKQK